MQGKCKERKNPTPYYFKKKNKQTKTTIKTKTNQIPGGSEKREGTRSSHMEITSKSWLILSSIVM